MALGRTTMAKQREFGLQSRDRKNQGFQRFLIPNAPSIKRAGRNPPYNLGAYPEFTY
jgi:hypothetical protein